MAKLKEMKCSSESTESLTMLLKVFFFCICDNRPWHFFICRFFVLFGWTFACHFLGRAQRIFSLSRCRERNRVLMLVQEFVVYSKSKVSKVRSIWTKSFCIVLIVQKNRCLQLKAAKKTFAHEIEAICATQLVRQPKMASNAWNRMASRSIPLGMLHKAFKSDFRKNGTTSTRSPSSNAKVVFSFHAKIYPK